MTSLTDIVALYLVFSLFLILVGAVLDASRIACFAIFFLVDHLVVMVRVRGLRAVLAEAWEGLTHPEPMTLEQLRPLFFVVLGAYAGLMTATWATGTEFLAWYAPSLEPDGSLLLRVVVAGVCANALGFGMEWARMGTRRFVAMLRETRLLPASIDRVPPQRWSIS